MFSFFVQEFVYQNDTILKNSATSTGAIFVSVRDGSGGNMFKGSPSSASVVLKNTDLLGYVCMRPKISTLGAKRTSHLLTVPIFLSATIS